MPNPITDHEIALHFERLYVYEHVARTRADLALREVRDALAQIALDATETQQKDVEQAWLLQTSRLGDVRALIESYIAVAPAAPPDDLAQLFVAALRQALRGGQLGERGYPINIMAADNIPRDTVLVSNGVTVMEFRLVAKDGAPAAELVREAKL